MARLSKNELYKLIETNMRAVKEERDHRTEDSFNIAVGRLQPGQMLPKRGRFHDRENLDGYNNFLEEKRRETAAAVREYLDGLKKDAVAGPSEDALRAVQMFALLDPSTLTETEYARRIEGMMTEYGKDPTTYETLRSMASKAGIHGFAPHEAIVKRNSADTLETTVNGFFNSCHSFGGDNEHVATDGSISFSLMAVESALDGLGE
jgi:hypothetical protein